MKQVTEMQTQAMDEMAEFAISNVVHLPRPGGNSAAVKDATAMLESAHAALQAAQAMHAAARIEKDVGTFNKELSYVSVYFRDLREFVTLGIDYSAPEPGDDEQPEIGETLDIDEVWLRGVDIGILLQDVHTDDLKDALDARRKAGDAL